MLNNLIKEVESLRNMDKAKIFQKFFRTGMGDYGEGDIFLGLSVPECRKIANKYDIQISEIEQLIKSKFHEERLIALFELLKLYQQNKEEKFINFYLNNTKFINNWDLVDLSCYKLLGDYLLNFKNCDYKILLNLSDSKYLWERRISIVTTMSFIKNNCFEPTLVISRKLIKDDHDLIKKANGWMLREVGKKDKKILEKFLKENIANISNVTLNYAMEKFEQNEKNYYRSLRNK